MAASKKRNKKYTPRTGENIKLKMQPWKVAAVFNPLAAILDQLEQDGTIDVAGQGTAVFKDAIDGDWYDSAVAILGVVEAYEIHEVRISRSLGMDPLRQLANKLQYSMPIFDSDTKACRESLGRMKAVTLDMTAGYAKQLIKEAA